MGITLHHVNVTVTPKLEEATKHFYGEVLGLTRVPKPPTSRQSGAWYQIGPSQLHLSVENGEQRPLRSNHVCFAVSDLAEAEQKFRAAGVEIITDPEPAPNSPRFFARDPGGNLLEIAQASA
jgi:catechol 2,3-dioxygenase-like lactoylglutathione lyase family enzyme